MPVVDYHIAPSEEILERRDIQDQDWFLNNSTQFVIILSSVLGGICLICLYLLWRGPHQSKFPCFPSRRSPSSDTPKNPSTGPNSGKGVVEGKIDWSNASQAHNSLLASMRSDQEKKASVTAGNPGNIAVGPGGGGGGGGVTTTRKITKCPKTHNRTPSKAAHAISTTPTISSFGHTPDQGPISYFGSSASSIPISQPEVVTIDLAYPQPAAYVQPITPYSPPSAYPATPPTAYISSGRRPTMDQLDTGHLPFPYPGLNSWSNLSLNHQIPSSAMDSDISTASPSPQPMFNLFLPDTASSTSTITPSSAQTDHILSPSPHIMGAKLDFSRPRPPSQLLLQVKKADRICETGYSTISVYSQPEPIIITPQINPAPSSTPENPKPESIKRKSTLSQSYIPEITPSSPFIPFPSPLLRPCSSSPRQSRLSSSTYSSTNSKVSIPQLAKVKRGSYAASRRMSMRSSKPPPSPLRQSVISVKR